MFLQVQTRALTEKSIHRPIMSSTRSFIFFKKRSKVQQNNNIVPYANSSEGQETIRERSSKSKYANNLKTKNKNNSIALIHSIKKTYNKKKTIFFGFVCILLLHLFLFSFLFFHVIVDIQSCQPLPLSREFGLFPGGFLDGSWNGTILAAKKYAYVSCEYRKPALQPMRWRVVGRGCIVAASGKMLPWKFPL